MMGAPAPHAREGTKGAAHSAASDNYGIPQFQSRGDAQQVQGQGLLRVSS